jgi:hypothetical protein
LKKKKKKTKLVEKHKKKGPPQFDDSFFNSISIIVFVVLLDFCFYRNIFKITCSKNKNGYIYLNCCDFGWWFMGFESIPH